MKKTTKALLVILLVAIVFVPSLALLAACPDSVVDFVEDGIGYEYYYGPDHDSVTGTTEVRVVGFELGDLPDGSVIDCVVPAEVQHDGKTYTVVGFSEYGVFVSNGYVGTLSLPATFRDFDLYNRDDPESLKLLRYIEVDNANPYMRSLDGVLYTADLTQMLCFPAARQSSTFDLPSQTEVFPQNCGMYECPSLQSVNVGEGNRVFSSYDGLLYTDNGTRLDFYPLGREQTVLKLDERAATFSRKVVISQTVRQIELDENNPYLKVQNNMLLSKDGEILFFAPQVSEKYFAIPDGVVAVAVHALPQVRELFVPRSVTTLLDCYVGGLPSSLRNICFEATELPRNISVDPYVNKNFGWTRQQFEESVGAN